MVVPAYLPVIDAFRLNKQNPELANSNSGPCYLILSRKSRIFSSIRRIVSRNASSDFPVGAWKVRTLHIAAHGDDNIHRRDIRQQLAVLGGFHVDAVDLLYQPDSILVDPWLSFRAGGIAFKRIGSQFLSQRLRNLAAAGIVDADKSNLFHGIVPSSFLMLLIGNPACIKPVRSSQIRVFGQGRKFCMDFLGYLLF